MPAVGSETKYAVIDAAAIGNQTLVAAVTGKKLRVLALFVVSAGVQTAIFQSGAGGTALTGGLTLAASTVVSVPFNPEGWFETAAGALLNLNLSAAVSVDGALVYQEVG